MNQQVQDTYDEDEFEGLLMMNNGNHKESLLISLGMLPVPEHLYAPRNPDQANAEKIKIDRRIDKNAAVIPLQTKKCMTCGNEFYRKKYRSNPQWESMKFCSVACSRNRLG